MKKNNRLVLWVSILTALIVAFELGRYVGMEPAPVRLDPWVIGA